MSNTASELKYDRECLRLASDLMQLSRQTLNPDLQAHCVRMATYWAEQVDGNPNKDLTNPDDQGE